MAATKNSVAHTLIHISPNFISSDLFHPGWVKKLPRCPTPRRKSDHWGKDKTYGGIGKLRTLPPLGGVEPNTARSHRHYGSGLQNFQMDPKVQHPIQIKITEAPDLALSNKVMHDPSLKQDPPTCHLSKFEVFPRFDPRRNEFDDPCERTLLEEIGPATMKALDELSNLIYRQSEHQQVYTHPNPEDISKIRLQLLRQLLAAEEIAAWELERNKNLEKDDDNEEQEDTDVEEKNKDVNTVEKTLEKTPTSEFSKASSIKESKGSSNQPRKVDLLSHKPPIQTLKLKPINLSQQQQQRYASARSLKLAMPKVADYGKSKMRFAHQDVTVPRIPVSNDSTSLSDLRIGDPSLLTYRKRQFPAMLGKAFKNDAHIRYHRNHPESIPDLRNSITVGKQHWFYGVHASLLR